MVFHVGAGALPIGAESVKIMKRYFSLADEWLWCCKMLAGAMFLAVGTFLVMVGCSSSKVAPTPPMPRTSAVILAVESQRATVRTALTAPADTNPVTLTIRTSAPVSIAAAAPVIKRGSLSLAWSAYADPRVAGYRIYYGVTPMVYFYSADAGNVTNATIKGLEEGVSYSAAVVAYFADGTESRPSNEATGVTPFYISLAPQCWQVSAYGMLGKTNLVKVSTNLTTWQTLGQFVGDGELHGFLHTNQAVASFRVEVKL